MRARLLAALLVLAAAGPGAARAASTPTDPNALRSPNSEVTVPAGHRLSARRVIAVADGVPSVRDARRAHPGLTSSAFLKGTTRWQVSYYGKKGKEIAQVTINDATGTVQEAWTGFQVAWTMARGYPGAFGRKASALYLWIPLCLLFVIPFVDRRRWRRWLHLDLLVLVSLSISLAFFSHGKIGLSVPLAYPVLLYLLVRMLVLARGRNRRSGPLRLSVPVSWMAIALVFLVGFRIGLNVTDSNVIDVGYAGVIGAHKIAGGDRLYGAFPRDNAHGDTYGPASYEAYVPFERTFGWSGRWDDLPAAHAASVFFDLLTMLGLWLLGRRVRGPTLGIALAYAWAAFPFTLFTLDSNTNDSLVALLIVFALLAATHPARRGALAALAGFTKFAPLALAPLLARSTGEVRVRPLALFAAAFAATTVLVGLPVLTGASASTIYHSTIGYQSSRGSPFSVWGLWGLPHAAQLGVQLAGAALAVVVAFVPRCRDIFQVAALGAVVLIALQLGISHWFYLYVVWFFPLVMLALLGRYPEGEESPSVL
ncbi:MAG: glycosyltransferase 87 family protein [Solirubrobacteraceae bacterium]